MNKQRRKELGDLIDQLTALQPAVGELLEKLDGIKEKLESLRDEEQEAYDNLPESIQNSERGEDAQYAVNKLDEAFDALDDWYQNLEQAPIEDICSDIDESRGNA